MLGHGGFNRVFDKIERGNLIGASYATLILVIHAFSDAVVYISVSVMYYSDD